MLPCVVKCHDIYPLLLSLHVIALTRLCFLLMSYDVLALAFPDSHNIYSLFFPLPSRPSWLSLHRLYDPAPAVIATTPCLLLELPKQILSSDALPSNLLETLFRYASMRVQWRNSRLDLVHQSLGLLEWQLVRWQGRRKIRSMREIRRKLQHS